MFDEIDKAGARFELLSPNEVFRIPLIWLIEELCLVVQVSHDGRDRFEVLFGNVKQCFSQENFMRLLRTQMVGFNLDRTTPVRNVYISCDVAAFKCLPSKASSVPHKFLVSFNPPLCVQNLFAELDEGLDCAIMGEELVDHAGRVQRGEVQYFYDVDPYSKFQSHSLYFSFRVDENNKRCFLLGESEEAFVFQSSRLKLRRKEEAKATDSKHLKVRKEWCKFEMYRGDQFRLENEMVDDPAVYNNFELIVEFLPFNTLNTVSENFELDEKVFERTSA